MRQKYYVWGFPGIGKSFANSNLRIVDADCERFKFLVPEDAPLHSREAMEHARMDPSYPDNYWNYVRSVDADLVLLNCHIGLLGTLDRDRLLLVYPAPKLKEEYLRRYAQRGDNESYVRYMETAFDEVVAAVKRSPYRKYEVTDPHIYLQNLIERGTLMEQFITKQELAGLLGECIQTGVYTPEGPATKKTPEELAQMMFDGNLSLDISSLRNDLADKKAQLEQERVLNERRGGLSHEELSKKIMEGIVNGALDIRHCEAAPYSHGFEVTFRSAQQGSRTRGCGKGRFTAETAAAHPEDLFVAVERVPDAMVIAMERCRAMGLANVFFIDGDAAALENYFAPGEVDLIYINFCDPWPSVKHSRRRLTHEGFLRGYRHVLREGGQIHFKTDNHDLFEWSLFQFPKAGFALSEVTRDLHAHGVRGGMTDYEEKFHALGTPINRCVGTMGALPDVPLEDGLARRLPDWEVRPVGEMEVGAVAALLQTDPDYFALEGRRPTVQSVLDDIAFLPPRCAAEQKHYLALWKDGAPQAVLDLVEDCPRERTLFVGFCFLSPALRGQGRGREIMDAALQAAGDAGMDRARLACLLSNESGRAFWRAMGFGDLRQTTTLGEHPNPVWLMERLV